jgi:hypothetical protein
MTWLCAAALAPGLGACTAGEVGSSLGAHTSADAGKPMPPPDAGPPDGKKKCTYTQGFWKNHPDEWPVEHLTIGGVTYDEYELLALLNTPPRGDASLILAHQLITALLNVEHGAPPIDAIAHALAWMDTYASGGLPAGVDASSHAGRRASYLAERLDDYNNGRTGPGHCDDYDYDYDRDDRYEHDYGDCDRGHDEGYGKGCDRRDYDDECDEDYDDDCDEGYDEDYDDDCDEDYDEGYGHEPR